MTPQEFIDATPALRTRMLGTAMRYLSEREDAEDVVQEVIISVWERKERFQSADDAHRYAAEAVKNTSLNVLRQRKTHPSASVDYLLETNGLANTDTALAYAEESSGQAEREAASMQDRLMKAVKALPQRDRDLIRLRNIEELPYSDISRLLGISEGAIRTRLSRLRTHLILQMKSNSP